MNPTCLFSVGEIVVNYNPDFTQKRTRVKASRDAYNMMAAMWGPYMSYREDFCLLCLNRANDVIGFYRVSSGATSSTVVDLKHVFGVALGCLASSIIVAHNHPSANLTPSQADKELTRKIKDAGKLLDIAVLDHLILTPQDTYFSFADDGIL